MTTFNRRPLLPRAIASVLAQDEQDFELIIVDDCSADDTAAYLRSLDDPRIRALRLPTNLGPAAARNLGLRAARAEIVALLDDDDVYLQHRLSAPIAVFRREPDVVATLSSSIKLDLKRTQMARMPDLTLAAPAFEWAMICDLVGVEGTSITVRRQTALDIGGFCESLRLTEDREFLIRLARRGSGHLIAEPLWKKHWSEDGLSVRWQKDGLHLLNYVGACPEFVGRFRKVGSYLAMKILVSDLRHGFFAALARDFRNFRRAGLIDCNIVRLLRDHRDVHRYRRAMSRHEALATLTQAPDRWD